MFAAEILGAWLLAGLMFFVLRRLHRGSDSQKSNLP